MQKLKPHKILVVEDCKEIRELIAICLEVHSWEVLQADCLEYAKRYISDDIDAVLTDYHLPDGLGTELLTSFDKPVIICSSKIPDLEHPRYLGSIKKPFKPCSLAHQISQILEKNPRKEN